MIDVKLDELREYDGRYQVISSRKMARRLEKEPESKIRVKSLISSLDDAIEDFRDGELIVISGPTKNGKTLLAQTLTVNFAKQKHFSLWFQHEVPVRQFLSQFPSVPQLYLPQQQKPYALDWLERRVYECHVKYKTRIIFVDHLHYLLDMVQIKNPSLEIGAVCRRLKSLAVEGRFIIFLLAHTTKGKSASLSYENIRDSSFVAQESDVVLMIQRTPDIAENAAQLKVEFHRRTGVLQRDISLIKFGGLLIETSQLPSNRKQPGGTEQDDNEATGDQ